MDLVAQDGFMAWAYKRLKYFEYKFKKCLFFFKFKM